MNATIITKKIEYLATEPTDSTAEQLVANPPILKLVRLGFRMLGPIFPKYTGKFAFQLFSTPRIRAMHKTSDEILESAKVFEFLYGKQLLKGYEWGKEERTILLVHGWESRGTALRSFVPALVQAGYRVAAFDGPAHGNSAGKQTNLVHFAGAIRAAIRQVGNVHGIITHSFGGASTVFALANMKPSIALQKLVLIAVPNSLEKVLQNAVRTMGLPQSASKYFFQIVEERLQMPVHQADVSRAHDKLDIKDTLIIHDKRDGLVPFKNAENIYEHWDNATLVVVDGFGHYRLMKNAEVIDRVARFMNDAEL